MTKRFTQRLYETGERFLEDNETDCFYEIIDSFVNVELLCERLNKLVEENEQLKQENQQITACYDICASEKRALEIENEQIKQTIKEAYRNERTYIGESVLRQLIDQIME